MTDENKKVDVKETADSIIREMLFWAGWVSRL